MLIPGPTTNSMSWENYMRLETIYTWMDGLASDFPEKCKVYNIGRSVEDREIKLIKVGTHNRNYKRASPKPSVFIEGGLHAREWISPATVTFITKELGIFDFY
ncbi:carboxypeptidase B-like [Eurytemora carolleeae]|uniref:carboxypeptidase B-like n=1 Tax=Eurytemora carolleeae TaxID=1294199 RepID=UPI000C78DF56|nr:carboxypeptidase B-like [Eurytemora carolleeae]|eukprot:XP_023341938.1 carboxypeptidase B-like [Eurytemora affinis]